MKNKKDNFEIDLTSVDIIDTATNEVLMSTGAMLNIDLDEKVKETFSNQITTLVSGLGHLFEASYELSSNGSNGEVIEQFRDIKIKMREYVLMLIEQNIDNLSYNDLELFKLLCKNALFEFEINKLINTRK